MIEAAAAALARLRTEQPLIHILSNLVTMGDVANATLAIGARPIMAQAPEEVGEIALGSHALVLNLGTPTRERVQAMLLAGQAANERGIPIVFDPVGFGASRFRSESAAQLLEQLRISVIRGNGGELATLCGIGGAMSGVDAKEIIIEPAHLAERTACRYNTLAVLSGAVDYASDGQHLVAVENGSPLLQRISGAGDILDVLIAAALTVEKDPLIAATSGLVWMGVSSEIAASAGTAIGSFRIALVDAFGNLDGKMLERYGRIKVLR